MREDEMDELLKLGRDLKKTEKHGFPWMELAWWLFMVGVGFTFGFLVTMMWLVGP